MEDSWSRDSLSKWDGQPPQQGHPNHGQVPRGAGAVREQGGDPARVWVQSDVLSSDGASLIDDTIGQFRNLTLGEAAAATGQVVMEGLDMACLRIEGDPAQPGVGQVRLVFLSGYELDVRYYSTCFAPRFKHKAVQYCKRSS